MTEQNEWKPCPFCGKPPILEDDWGAGYSIGCIQAFTPPDKEEFKKDDAHPVIVMIKTKEKTIEQWNSAWCWKEIDRLKEENESLRRQIKDERARHS